MVNRQSIGVFLLQGLEKKLSFKQHIPSKAPLNNEITMSWISNTQPERCLWSSLKLGPQCSSQKWPDMPLLQMVNWSANLCPNVPSCIVMVHWMFTPCLGPWRQELFLYIIYILYIWKHLSHPSVYECPPGILRNSRALGYLDYSSPSAVRMKMHGLFQIKARFKVSRRRVLGVWLGNMVRIAPLKACKLSDPIVLPLDLNFVKFFSS